RFNRTLELNIRKLRYRYGEKFSSEGAINRVLIDEKLILTHPSETEPFEGERNMASYTTLPFYCTNCGEEFQAKDAGDFHVENSLYCTELKERFRVDIRGSGEKVWSNSNLTFDTEEEARKYVFDLFARWFGFDAYRIVPASTPR